MYNIYIKSQLPALISVENISKHLSNTEQTLNLKVQNADNIFITYQPTVLETGGTKTLPYIANLNLKNLKANNPKQMQITEYPDNNIEVILKPNNIQALPLIPQKINLENKVFVLKISGADNNILELFEITENKITGNQTGSAPQSAVRSPQFNSKAEDSDDQSSAPVYQKKLNQEIINLNTKIIDNNLLIECILNSKTYLIILTLNKYNGYTGNTDSFAINNNAGTSSSKGTGNNISSADSNCSTNNEVFTEIFCEPVDSIELKDNTLTSFKYLNDIAKQGVIYTHEINNPQKDTGNSNANNNKGAKNPVGDSKIKIISGIEFSKKIVYVNKTPALTKNKKLIPYAFLEAVKAQNYTLCRRYMADSLSQKLTNKQLGSFFKNALGIKQNLYVPDKKDALALIYKNGEHYLAMLYSFEMQPDPDNKYKISNIIEL